MRRLNLAGIALLFAFPAAAQPTLRVSGPPVALTRADDGPFVNPRWSPSGSLIAFSSIGYAGLWVIDPDGSNLRQVTDAPDAGFGYAWSPDGSHLLTRLSREQNLRRRHAVVLFDAADGSARELTDYRTRMPSLPEWAPGTADVVLPAARTLERLDAGLPPTARKAGTSDRFILLREGRPVVADADQRTTAPLDLFDGEMLLNLVTAPDGRRVAFEVLGGNAFVFDPDEGAPVDLGPVHRPQWSPDGRWVIAMSTEDDGERFTASDLVAVRSDGTATIRLTDSADRLEMNPSWSPDGRHVVYDDLKDGIIYLIPIVE